MNTVTSENIDGKVVITCMGFLANVESYIVQIEVSFSTTNLKIVYILKKVILRLL